MLLNDVTLREANQMPGRDYSVEQKVEAGEALDDLGVSYIQTGFAVTGERDREVSRRLASSVSAETSSLARSVVNDVDAVIDAEADIVDIILPLSDSQLTHTLGKSRDEAISMADEAVTHAKTHGLTIHVSLIDAFRTEITHLVEFFERFPTPEYINLADTVGARTPKTVRETLAALDGSVDVDRVGVHFHDDMGVGTANTLAAFEAGVTKADVSVASLGERAGNAALEEVVVAGEADSGHEFGIETDRLVPACERVLDSLGESVQPRKPVLSEETTTHESGLHTAAMLHDPSVFEPFDPTRFGGKRHLLFGSGTGRASARILLERADRKPTNERVDKLLSSLEREGPLTLSQAIELASQD